MRAWVSETVGGRSGAERKNGAGGHRPRVDKFQLLRPSALGLFQKRTVERSISIPDTGAVPGLWMRDPLPQPTEIGPSRRESEQDLLTTGIWGPWLNY